MIVNSYVENGDYFCNLRVVHTANWNINAMIFGNCTLQMQKKNVEITPEKCAFQ